MLLSVNSVSKSFGDELLFEDVSFSIDDNDKIGFVGANGAGKSTLVRILMGEMSADGGNIFKNKFTKIGYLEQYACSGDDRSIFDELLTIFPEQLAVEQELEELHIDLEGSRSGDEALIARQTKLSERYAEIGGFTYKSRIRSSLIGLGFSEEELKKRVSTLSGGQKTRVALAKILLSDCNLLFLDEPTNHLDIDSIRWLEDFIRTSRAAFLIISHDRYFLDRVTNRTFSLESKRFHSMNLPYSGFAAQRDIQRLTEQRSYDNTMREIERLEGGRPLCHRTERWKAIFHLELIPGGAVLYVQRAGRVHIDRQCIAFITHGGHAIYPSVLMPAGIGGIVGVKSDGDLFGALHLIVDLTGAGIGVQKAKAGNILSHRGKNGRHAVHCCDVVQVCPTGGKERLCI